MQTVYMFTAASWLSRFLIAIGEFELRSELNSNVLIMKQSKPLNVPSTTAYDNL